MARWLVSSILEEQHGIQAAQSDASYSIGAGFATEERYSGDPAWYILHEAGGSNRVEFSQFRIFQARSSMSNVVFFWSNIFLQNGG
jgi:hypothetical protein